ncbi:MAG TPA: HEAT repeat domain-containing protein [Oligoflexus sp.]|uniref:HEAT repeat domain-containing protein n=1 Tax=Oligoflexus sp. TaxID=1971216 RepID=UPI002D58CCB4|nr:HEAT repeat domain-containing protein [Oligoflexus sp.]HYX37175.1 HEAT repeat domain-containing protein [Oligoflexus sp.]
MKTNVIVVASVLAIAGIAFIVRKPARLNEVAVPQAPDVRPVTSEKPMDHVAPNSPVADDEVFQRLRQLRESGRKSDSRTLLPLLETQDRMIQIEVLATLHKIGDAETVPAIVRLSDTEDTLLLRGVISALAGIGERTPVGSQGHLILQPLTRIFQREKNSQADDAEGNVFAVVKAIGSLRHPSAVEFLTEQLEVSTDDPVMQAAIVRALGRMNAQEAVPVLERLATSIRQRPADISEHFKLAYEDLQRLTQSTLEKIARDNP